MQYMNSSFRYIGRHFWRMLLYFILPAIVLGAANSPVSLIKLLTQSDFGDSLPRSSWGRQIRPFR